MIIKGRSPTMRHVSRTHRVVLDWLFDRINLDPKIQIRYIDSKHQIADILTKGNFRRDEWNNLLHLFNISLFSSVRCTKNFSLISCITLEKRIQEQKEGEKDVSKWRPAVMNVSSYLMSSSSSAASSPISSKSHGKSGPADAASTSQVRLKGAYLGELMEQQPHQKKENSEETDDWNLSRGITSLLLELTKIVGKPLAAETAKIHLFSVSKKSKQERSDIGTLLCHIATNNPLYRGRVRHGQVVLSRPSGDPMEDFDVNVAIW